VKMRARLLMVLVGLLLTSTAQPQTSSELLSVPPWPSLSEPQLIWQPAIQVEGAAGVFSVPANSLLRLDTDATPPILWRSADAVLWREGSWSRTSGDGGWVSTEASSQQEYARLEYPAAESVEGEVSLQVATFVEYPLPRRFQLLQPDNGQEAVTLKELSGDRHQLYSLPLGQSLHMPVEGPAVVALMSRPLNGCASGESSAVMAYQLDWALDEQPYTDIQVRRPQLSRQLQYWDDCALQGGLDRHYIQVPAGQHRLRLAADRVLLLAAARYDPDDFLVVQPPVDVMAPAAAEADEPLRRLDALRRSNHRTGTADDVLSRLAQSPNSRLAAAAALATAIEQEQRFYRDLWPLAGTSAVRHIHASFSPGRARSFAVREPGTVYLQPGTAWNQIQQGHFSMLKEGWLEYPIPQRSAATRLRVSVLLPESGQPTGELLLRFDQSAPLRLPLVSLLSSSEMPGDAVILAQAQAIGWPSGISPTLAPGLPSSLQSVPYRRSASVELVLPVGVGSVSVYSDHELAVGLQYRTSQAFGVGESAYHRLLEQADMPLLPLLQRSLHGLPDAEALRPHATATERLQHQWYPLLRELYAAGTAFQVGMDPIRSAVVMDRPAERLARAQVQAQQQDWAAVVLTLGTLEFDSVPAYRLTADARTALGEQALSRRQRTAVALFGRTTEVRRHALDDLLQDDAHEQDWERQVALLSAVWMQKGIDAELVERLGSALQQRGDDLWAVQLGLLLDERHPYPQWLYTAARNVGWTRTAAQLRARLPASRQALLLAEHAWQQGDHEQALQLIASAGSVAEADMLEQRVRDTRRILADLGSSSEARRHEGVMRWLEWSASQESRHWRTINEQVTRAAGYRLLHSRISGRYWSRLQATPEQPVELEVVGPAVLRISARRILPSGQRTDKQRDWMVVDSAQGQYHYPLLAGPASTTLQLVHGTAGVSTGQDFLLDVPAGLQRIRLTPRYHTQLLSVDQWEPVSNGGLPRVTPNSLRVLLAGTTNTLRTPHREHPPSYISIDRGRLQPLPVTASLLDVSAAPDHRPVADLWRDVQALALRPPGWLPDRYAVSLPASEPANTPAVQALVALWQLDQSSSAEQASAVVLQLAELAKGHEHWRMLPVWAQVAADEQQHDWQLLTPISSGGELAFPLESQPLGTFSEVRQALLARPGPSARLLTDTRVHGLVLQLPAPARVRVVVDLATLPHVQAQPAGVNIRVDEQPVTRLRLHPRRRAELDVSLEAGEHVLRVWQDAPWQDQYLWLRFLDAAGQPYAQSVDNRSYQTALPEQPLRYELSGPAWLRIDEQTPTGNRRHYRYLSGGWQSLQLPAGIATERYYRVARLQRREQSPDTLLPAIPVTLPDWSWSAPPAQPEAGIWQLTDRHLPGGLDHLGGYLMFSGQRDEDGADSTYSGTSRELGLRYRLRLPAIRGYARSDLLLRQLSQGDHLLGARQWLDIYPARSPWSLQFYGAAYLQPSVAGMQDAGTHGALQLRAELEHRTALSRELTQRLGVSLTRRWMSLNQPDPDILPRLDPDMYSRYREQHPYQLRLREQLDWQPWLDQRWYARGDLVTNDDLNPLRPDYLSLTLAAEQLLTPELAAEAGLRWRRYFADDDRDTGLDRTRLFLGADWLNWRHNGSAFSLGGRLDYDLEADELSWRLVLSHDAGRGDMLPAMRPGERDFLPLRRALQGNRIELNRMDREHHD